MLKIILLKRITISILSGLLYSHNNSSQAKGIQEAIGSGLLNLPNSTQVDQVAAIARLAVSQQIAAAAAAQQQKS